MNANDLPLQACSYKDAHGGTVLLGPEQVLTYAGVKTEQLSVITRLLTEAAAGDLDLDKSALQTLQLMANEYVHSVDQLVDLAARHEGTRKRGELTASKKGGK